MRRALLHLASSACVFGIVCACGSRTGLQSPDALLDGGPTPDCVTNEDCDNSDKCKPQSCVAGKCVKGAEVKCDDGDPCTDDSCDSQTGNCIFRPVSLDLDGDGHRGPKPGKKAGDPDACGDDCDDTNPKAYPGAPEVCDGVDNDCNGIVDDGAQYLPKQGAGDGVRLSSSALTKSYPGGLAFDGTHYFADYTGTSPKERIFGGLIDSNGQHLSPESRLAQVESDAYAGSAVWTGDRFGVVWEDRRFNNYEVFFAMFDKGGQKMAPGDVRISDSPAFSVNPSVVWTGREFVVVWQDGEGADGSFDVYAQRLELDGRLIGSVARLTQQGGESPRVAAGRPGLGIAWTRTRFDGPRVFFRAFDYQLQPIGQEVQLSPQGTPGRYPEIVWNQNNFVAAWTDPTTTKTSVWGAIVDGTGNTVVAAKQVSDSSRFARDPSLIPLGDRVIVVFADSRDQNGGFELYSRMLDDKLVPKGPSARLTTHTGDSTSPIAHFGPQGEIGVLFRDDREGAPQTYFTSLVCRAP